MNKAPLSYELTVQSVDISPRLWPLTGTSHRGKRGGAGRPARRRLGLLIVVLVRCGVACSGGV